MTGAYELSGNVLDDLDQQGVSYSEVVDLLKVEGVQKFEQAWEELYASVKREAARLS